MSITPALPLPRALGAVDGHERFALLFVTVIMASSVFLQRFGVPAGGKAINWVGPIGLALAAWGLLRGSLTFSPPRLAAYLALCLLVLLGMVMRQVAPSRFLVEPSLLSVVQFLILTSFATLSFARPLPEGVFVRRVTAVLAMAAVAGIAQFALQSVGLGLFSFRGLVPQSLLFEDGYNLQIPIGVGGLYKSNGFFMLEPSVFSQFMALALVLEFLTLRRIRLLGLFAAGLLLSVAGTGWIVLASFLASAAFSMGRRGIVLSGLLASVLAIIGVAATVLAPDVSAAFAARLDEVTRPATSGHLRFVTPFWLLDDVFRLEPAAALAGIGAGVSERLNLPYEYVVNTPIKIAVEFGVPALLAYLAVLAAGRRTPTQRALLIPGMVMLLFAGGYQQLAPALFPVLLMMSVANLQPD